VTGESILFFVFAGIALGGAVMVIAMHNPMYSALSLLSTFLSMAGLFFLLNAEFIGVVQIFVYGGGIMVLFLFVIMLVNLHNLREVQLFFGQSRVAAIIIALLALIFVWKFLGLELGPAFAEPGAFVEVGGVARGNTEAVAWTLYRDYLLPFEIASVFLLVAMIGAVVLGRRE